MSLTVQLGDLPLEFDTSEWHALIGQQIQGAFEFEALGKAKAVLVRTAMKLMMHEVLDRFERASLAGALDVPPPDRARADADVLTYGTSYLAAFLIGELEKLSFVADFEEGEHGAIRITGLHAAPALAGNEPSLFLPAGPENGPTDATALAAPAVSQPGEPACDSGERGGYVDAGGDEGQREDVCGEAAGA